MQRITTPIQMTTTTVCQTQKMPSRWNLRSGRTRTGISSGTIWALANYYGMISHIDWCIGRLLDELESLSLSQNTIIIFLSDHGEYVGDHGLLYKGSLLGAYPWHNGVYHQVYVPQSLSPDMTPDVQTYSQRLNDAGYRLGYVGKWHASRFRGPLDFGYHNRPGTQQCIYCVAEYGAASGAQ